jgi:phospholipase C
MNSLPLLRRAGSAVFLAALVSGLIATAAACGSDSGGGVGEKPAVSGQPDAPTPDSGPVCLANEGLCNGSCGARFEEDTRCGPGACAVACSGGTHCQAGTCRASNIEHVVLIVQENHSFDSYFGKYCTAPAGSNPTCTQGRACCEGAPKVNGIYTEASGATALLLDDAFNFKSDHNHDRVCELQQINGGAMDQFVRGASGASTCLGVGPNCSDPSNWALADGEPANSPIRPYWTYADKYAIADRYFQPMAGGSAGNDIYFAEARFRFIDNQSIPNVRIGTSTSKTDRLCTLVTAPQSCVDNQRAQFAKPTIANLLLDQGKTFRIYADGYGQAAAAQAKGGDCVNPGDVAECRYKDCSVFGGHPVACHACLYDPSDVPFMYYERFADAKAGPFKPSPYIQDYLAFKTDIAAKQLPNFSFIKARSWRNEHPNVSNLSDGVAFVQSAVNAVLESSEYRDNTLVLLTWDEGGGYYDHVPPPKAVSAAVDSDELGKPVPYGTRVPLIAIGPLAKIGTVSHRELEHSSIVRFLEWNFLTATGQLGTRDAVVNNLGSLLDGAKTGIAVPDR